MGQHWHKIEGITTIMEIMALITAEIIITNLIVMAIVILII
jgi:hypothetical protein